MKQQPEFGTPTQSMDADAISMNEIVQSYERAGFSRGEAMELIKHHIWTSAHVGAEQARWEATRGEQG